jgi:hypothetical protein
LDDRRHLIPRLDREEMTGACDGRHSGARRALEKFPSKHRGRDGPVFISSDDGDRDGDLVERGANVLAAAVVEPRRPGLSRRFEHVLH